MRVRVFDDGAGECGADKAGDAGVWELVYVWGGSAVAFISPFRSCYLCFFCFVCFYSLKLLYYVHSLVGSIIIFILHPFFIVLSICFLMSLFLSELVNL